ncbi:MAG: tetratricopeptide repeat protein [Myxococcota bacterium]
MPGGPSSTTRIYPEEDLRDEDARTADPDAPSPFLLPESGPSGAPSKVGRYVVLDVLGVGGMGVVCTAYDPKLDRKVALKLLRRVGHNTKRGSTGRARLVREAQSLAKLSHPNIVTVHDVDTTPDGRIFMAMEFVQGRTISEWVNDEKPGWKQILQAFDDAGRGLASAHKAGITHRDFKPANVLVGEDGRVRVLDFGLAKSDSASDSTDSEDSRSDIGADDIMQVVQSASDMKLTMAGRIVGTPAYMAPEQRRGKSVGPATDQFSFAVALYEALYNRLPYRADSHSRDAARGRVLDPPKDTDVPAWVLRAFRRSLSPTPADRYPTMDALLGALRADPAVRRRKIFTAAGLVTLVGAAAGFGAVALQGEDELCRGAQRRLDGIWDEATRSAVDGALRNTATAYAAYTAERVVEDLDAYATAWVDARVRVCEATWVHGEQSETTLDVRMGCLDQRQGELRALVQVLEDADASVVERAVGAVASLEDVQACITADPEGQRRLPSDPAQREVVLATLARLDDAEALMKAGRYVAGQDIATEALATALEVGHDPTTAQALYVAGITARRTGNYDLAGDRLDKAAELAARADEPSLEALAWITQVQVQGVHKRNRAEALGVARAARSAMARAGDSAGMRAKLAKALGATALTARELDEAIGYMREALTAADKAYPPGDLRFASLYDNLGVALAQLGERTEAEMYLRRALALREAELGAMHPRVAKVAQNLANVLASRPSAIEEAIDLVDRAMTIRRAVFGPQHTAVGDLWAAKAHLSRVGGKDEAALEEYERAAAIYRNASEAEKLGSTLNNMATLLTQKQRYTEAEREARAALRAFDGTSKPHRLGAARASRTLCTALRHQGAYPQALASCESAVATFKDTLGETHDDLSAALLEQARVLHGQGRVEGAVDSARRSVAAASGKTARTAGTEFLALLQGE